MLEDCCCYLCTHCVFMPDDLGDTIYHCILQESNVYFDDVCGFFERY